MRFEKGCTPWNKGLKGVQIPWNKGISASAETKTKMSEAHKGHPGWNKGKPWSDKIKRKMSDSRKGQVAWNKGLIGVSKGRPKGMKHTEEAKKKMSEALRGRRPWNYIDGQSKNAKRAYGTIRYKEWRMSVYERDEFICQICRAWGKRLNCHHIKSFYDYPELRFDIENGITFCEDCHMDLHGLMTKVVEH